METQGLLPTAKAGGDHNGSDGSGIGTGDEGRFTGTVTIGGNAAVVAEMCIRDRKGA